MAVPLRRSERVLTVAHRGGAHHRPENTIPAFDHAVSLGVDVIEMDVQQTADDTLVVIHDETVDRTTDGSGTVASLTDEELFALDAGHHFTPDGGDTYSYRDSDVRIPRLETVLNRYHETPLLIELKGGTVEPDALLSCLDRHHRRSSVLIGGFEDEVLATLRSRAPDLVTGLGMAESQRVADGSMTDPPGSVLFPPVDLVAESVVHVAHDLELAVWPWTANEPDVFDRLIDLSADAIITDDPATLLELT